MCWWPRARLPAAGGPDRTSDACLWPSGLPDLYRLPELGPPGDPDPLFAPRGNFGGLGTAGGCAAARVVDHVRTFTPKQYLTAYGVDALHGEGLLGQGQAVAIISEEPATQGTWPPSPGASAWPPRPSRTSGWGPGRLPPIT